jgi:hypothetical protein
MPVDVDFSAAPDGQEETGDRNGFAGGSRVVSIE